MPINLKALYASLLAALPAPLILALVEMGTDAELTLGSMSSVVAYLIAFVVLPSLHLLRRDWPRSDRAVVAKSQQAQKESPWCRQQCRRRHGEVVQRQEGLRLYHP